MARLSVATGAAALWQYETNTDTIQLNITSNTNWPKQNKETVGSARRLLQYSQLPDKIPAIFRGISGIFRGATKVLFYSTISRATPDDIPRNPGWETLPQQLVLGSNLKTRVYITGNTYTYAIFVSTDSYKEGEIGHI
jgi:hypothetical protein